MSNLTEGDDFYFNENGLMIFTSSFHLNKKKCCGCGCIHCPYEYINVELEKRKQLLQTRPPIILLSKK